MAVMEINMSEMISSITLTVKVGKTTRARMWLGARAMGLAARIFGCKGDVATDDEAMPKFSLATINAPCVPGGKALALCDHAGRVFGRQVGCSVSSEVGELSVVTVKLLVDGEHVSFGDAR